MKGEWCYFKKWFNDEQCDYILNLAESIPVQRSEIGTDDGVRPDEEYRRSDIRFITQADTRFQFLFDSVWKIAIQANNDWFKFHLSKLDYIQLAEYDSAEFGEYKRHHDVFWMNGDPEYHRKLSCVIQLTDPSEYEGGDLLFHNTANVPDPNEIRERGTAIFFPSFIEHQATPVTKGKRHSLASWIDGPKWR
jgi:PKHD-type hydroxylase